MGIGLRHDPHVERGLENIIDRVGKIAGLRIVDNSFLNQVSHTGLM